MADEASINDFGLLIAYVLPGFAALWGLTYITDALRPWLGHLPADAPTVGGFLFVTVASIAAGLTVSTLRWLLVDSLHHRTGIRPPAWDFSNLEQSAAAFGVLVEIHYRYYQFYANMLVAIAFVFLARRLSLGFFAAPVGLPDLGLLVVGAVFFLGSRDTLRKYYTRTGQLLRDRAQRRTRGRGARRGSVRA